MKNNNEITLFSLFVVRIPKRENSYKAKELCRLLIVLRLLIVADLLLIIIIIIIRNTRRANAEGSQLGRSQVRRGTQEATVDVSYAAPQAHEIVNVALHREYSPGIIFIFSQGRKDLYHV
jgi:hypothetical protein